MHIDYLRQHYYEFYKSFTKQYYDKFFFFVLKCINSNKYLLERNIYTEITVLYI